MRAGPDLPILGRAGPCVSAYIRPQGGDLIVYAQVTPPWPFRSFSRNVLRTAPRDRGRLVWPFRGASYPALCFTSTGCLGATILNPFFVASVRGPWTGRSRSRAISRAGVAPSVCSSGKCAGVTAPWQSASARREHGFSHLRSPPPISRASWPRPMGRKAVIAQRRSSAPPMRTCNASTSVCARRLNASSGISLYTNWARRPDGRTIICYCMKWTGQSRNLSLKGNGEATCIVGL